MKERVPRRRPRVGLDNYGLFPLRLTPLDTLRWALAHRAEGVAFSGLAPEDDAAVDDRSLDELAAFAAEHDLYLEWGGAQHVPRDLTNWAVKDVVAVNRRAAAQAKRLGVSIVRSCSGGLMRWHDDAPPTETLLRETAGALRAQASLWRDSGLTMAIETHFEFTSHELLRLIDMSDAPPGGWLGVCLDTMNLLTLLEDPVAATRRLLPWVVSTHVKDGGIILDADGLTTFPVGIGDGIVDLPAIVALVASLDRDVHLSVEDHAGTFRLPVFDPLFLSRFPDLTVPEFSRLVALAGATSARPSAAPLARGEWPTFAEHRMATDVSALRSLVERGAAWSPRS